MKYIIPVFLSALLLGACSREAPVATALQATGDTLPALVPEPLPAAEKVPAGHVTGYYTGAFTATAFDNSKKNAVYENKITVSVDSLRGTEVFGHSVVAGSSRPFSGSWTRLPSGYKIAAKEPGTDKYDGVFDFELDTVNGRITGTWTSLNSGIDVTKRKYTLEAREFKYDPSEALPRNMSGTLESDPATRTAVEDGSESGEMVTDGASAFNPSVVKLKKEDVENMYKGDLEVMRNSIYARHGYSFRNRRMRFIFDRQVSWYMPVTTDVRNVLTPLEKENIDLIKRYEDHAEKYYDSFGR